jgi:hypothetical protein
MDKLSSLIIRLHHLGYRTQTLGDEIVLELGPDSRVRGYEPIEGLIPTLTLKTTKRNQAKARPKKKAKKSKRNRVKVKLSSANIPAHSVEARPKVNVWRKTRSQAGIPGLGKRH